jgi:CBS domain-containing protein
MNDRDSATAWKLGVRSRLTFWGSGEPTLALAVLCPRRALDVPLEACVQCKDGRGMPKAVEGSDSFVLCDAPVDELHAIAAAEAQGPADRAPVTAIMTTQVICVGQTLPIVALEALFLDNGISGAPVVDRSGVAVGMVSKTDLIRFHQQSRTSGDSAGGVVADIMMPLALCLPANETVAKAAALMAFEGLHRVPIVNVHQQVVGLVSTLDVMRWMARKHGYVVGLGPREGSKLPAP